MTKITIEITDTEVDTSISIDNDEHIPELLKVFSIIQTNVLTTEDDSEIVMEFQTQTVNL